MDFVSRERYERALKKSMDVCPCRWWFQRYMVLTPVNHDQKPYKPGEILDGWQMTTQDIAGLLSGGAIGIVDTRPTGISGSVEEALAQAERLRDAGYRGKVLTVPTAAYYGYEDKRRLVVVRHEGDLHEQNRFDIFEPGVDHRTCHSLAEVQFSLVGEFTISFAAGWRPCFNRHGL